MCALKIVSCKEKKLERIEEGESANLAASGESSSPRRDDGDSPPNSPKLPSLELYLGKEFELPCNPSRKPSVLVELLALRCK